MRVLDKGWTFSCNDCVSVCHETRLWGGVHVRCGWGCCLQQSRTAVTALPAVLLELLDTLQTLFLLFTSDIIFKRAVGILHVAQTVAAVMVKRENMPSLFDT